MKKIPDPGRPWKAASAVLALSCLLCCLCGCTAQSTEIGRRAVVRLLYLENEGENYRALAVVCTFASDLSKDGEARNAVILTGTGRTLEEAIDVCASSQNQKPFFAQNNLLLLSPGLADSSLASVLDYFCGNTEIYRNPYVGLWKSGISKLKEVRQPMAFVDFAERLEKNNPAGRADTVFECAGKSAAALPCLEAPAEKEDPVLVRYAGIAVFKNGLNCFCTDRDELLAFGMLTGRVNQTVFTFSGAEGDRTIRLEKVKRTFSVRDGRLAIDLTAKIAEADCADKTFRNEAARTLEKQCGDAFALLCGNGRLDLLQTEWWNVLLGNIGARGRSPIISVHLYG